MNDKCYIITYQSINDTALVQGIKSYNFWAKITPTTWAIVTNKSATDIRDHLSKLLKLGERLFVVKSGAEAAWKNVVCTNEWLKKNI